jgi:uncharacterized protein YeaO (DUF488 family)
MIQVERVYEEKRDHSFRILVDRLWPRGLSRERAGIDLWLKDIAPSDELRREFSHNPERWDWFRERYFRELDGKKDLVEQMIRKARKGDMTLVYGAVDERFNNAVALREYLEREMKK